jgi:hypothetical protein
MSKWSSGKDLGLCNVYHCGSSPTDVILWFEMCRLLIAQARRKRLRWISCASLPTTSKWCSGKDNRLVSCTGCGSSPTEAVLWLEMCRILITQAREKRLRWISCGRLPTTSKWSSGKDYRLSNVPFWFKSYRSHFVCWNVSNNNYTS